jgi:hypothetical protein|tara:strand:+ start:1954 stop:2145 length:192 start_codon:yes stop_codon:yes gene_type:complete
MSKIKELKDKYGITATLVGGSLVVGSVFGQCVLSPPAETVEESVPTEQTPQPDKGEAPFGSDE